MKKLFACVLLVLGGCHDHRTSAPTAQQSQQLNDAENMLNATANEAGPADRSAGPSNSNE